MCAIVDHCAYSSHSIAPGCAALYTHAGSTADMTGISFCPQYMLVMAAASIPTACFRYCIEWTAHVRGGDPLSDAWNATVQEPLREALIHLYISTQTYANRLQSPLPSYRFLTGESCMGTQGSRPLSSYDQGSSCYKETCCVPHCSTEYMKGFGQEFGWSGAEYKEWPGASDAHAACNMLVLPDGMNQRLQPVGHQLAVSTSVQVTQYTAKWCVSGCRWCKAIMWPTCRWYQAA